MKKLMSLIALSLFLFAGVAAAQQSVNLNTADATALAEAITGVGPVKAEAIIEYREANGDFESVDQVVEVSGIGLATLENNRSRMTVGGGQSAEASGSAEDD